MSVITIGPGMEINTELDLRQVIRSLAYRRRKKRRSRTGGMPTPLWSDVGELAGHGSGYSVALCRWAGVHPETGQRLED